jgi:hypothetical protein
MKVKDRVKNAGFYLKNIRVYLFIMASFKAVNKNFIKKTLKNEVFSLVWFTHRFLSLPA